MFVLRTFSQNGTMLRRMRAEIDPGMTAIYGGGTWMVGGAIYEIASMQLTRTIRVIGESLGWLLVVAGIMTVALAIVLKVTQVVHRTRRW